MALEKVFVLVLLLVVFTNKFSIEAQQNVVDGMLRDRRVVEKGMDCVLNRAPCDPIGQIIKCEYPTSKLFQNF